MWRHLRADLHVHTVLSACAEVEMIPPLIVRRALELGLGVAAVTDHNAAWNVQAVIEAAEGTGLTVLPGMEVSSREEVHLVCLFDTLTQVLQWQARVYDALPNRENDESFFGPQYVVDAEGQHLRTETRLLSTATSLSLGEVVEGVRALGGIVIAAHVDRRAFSLIANLGFIPQGLELAGLELSRHCDLAEVARRLPETAAYGKVIGGDAHRLEEMTARTLFRIQSPCVEELALALAGRAGRGVEIA